MGMDPKYYLKAITPICEYIENGSSLFTNLQGKVKDGEIRSELPEKGHTVVLAFKQAETTCDWCYERVEQLSLIHI